MCRYYPHRQFLPPHPQRVHLSTISPCSNLLPQFPAQLYSAHYYLIPPPYPWTEDRLTRSSESSLMIDPAREAKVGMGVEEPLESDYRGDGVAADHPDLRTHYVVHCMDETEPIISPVLSLSLAASLPSSRPPYRISYAQHIYPCRPIVQRWRVCVLHGGWSSCVLSSQVEEASRTPRYLMPTISDYVLPR